MGVARSPDGWGRGEGTFRCSDCPSGCVGGSCLYPVEEDGRCVLDGLGGFGGGAGLVDWADEMRGGCTLTDLQNGPFRPGT